MNGHWGTMRPEADVVERLPGQQGAHALALEASYTSVWTNTRTSPRSL